MLQVLLNGLEKAYGKGIRVDLSNNEIKIDVYCVLNYGVSIPTVAQQIQDNIRQALYNMTGLETSEVNVHVVNVNFDTQKEEQVEEEQ